MVSKVAPYHVFFVKIRVVRVALIFVQAAIIHRMVAGEGPSLGSGNGDALVLRQVNGNSQWSRCHCCPVIGGRNSMAIDYDLAS